MCFPSSKEHISSSLSVHLEATLSRLTSRVRRQYSPAPYGLVSWTSVAYSRNPAHKIFLSAPLYTLGVWEVSKSPVIGVEVSTLMTPPDNLSWLCDINCLLEPQ